MSVDKRQPIVNHSIATRIFRCKWSLVESVHKITEKNVKVTNYRKFCRSMTTCRGQIIPVPKFCKQAVHCRLIQYILFRIIFAKCFTNCSGQFRWEVIFQKKHIFCSWIHHVRTCATGMSSGLATMVTLTQVSRGRLGESNTWGWTCFWFNYRVVIRDCC